MRRWPQNTKRRWPLRAVEGRVASVRSLSLPLAALWFDTVTLAAVWPAVLPGVDVWPPAQHDLAALWSQCLHVAQTAFHASVGRRNGGSLGDVPSPRRRVAADASRRWLRSGHRRFATFGRLSGSHGVPGGRGRAPISAAGTAAIEAARYRRNAFTRWCAAPDHKDGTDPSVPSLWVSAQLELIPSKNPALHVRLPASNLARSSARRSGTRVSARSAA